MWRSFIRLFCGFIGVLVLVNFATASAAACGGFFSKADPVAQNAERIIFAAHADGTMDTIIQINYSGNAEDFAWVVPVPNAPKLAVVNAALIRELEQRTEPLYIPPPNDCLQLSSLFSFGATGGAPDGRGVNVLGQGEVGPFDYAIIGADQPQALLAWLRTNGYRVTTEAEPIIALYVREQMTFVAMKLRAQRSVKDIQPIKLSYRATQPMLPMRIASVAANEDMGLLVWILGPAQAEPANYRAMPIDPQQLIFSRSAAGRGDNYQALVARTANWHGGRAFVTEYAAPTQMLASTVRDAELRKLLDAHPYLTRLYTRISPEEMTLDPQFRFNTMLPNVSNVHDLSRDWRVWDCDSRTNRAASPVEYYLYALTLNFHPLCLTGYGALTLGLIGFWQLKRRRKPVI